MIGQKLFKARVLSLLTKPYYYFQYKIADVPPFEDNTALILNIIPNANDITDKLDMRLITDQIDLNKVENIFQLEKISDALTKKGNILFADQLLNFTISELIKKSESGLNPKNLLRLYFKYSFTQRNLGNIGESYNYLNKALKMTMGCFSWNSYEMIELFDNFFEFSKYIHETKEAYIYNKYIAEILTKLKTSSNKNPTDNQKYLFYLLKHGYNFIAPQKLRNYNYIKDLFKVYDEAKKILLSNNIIINEVEIPANLENIKAKFPNIDITTIYYYFFKMSYELNPNKREAILNNLDTFLFNNSDLSNPILREYFKDRILYYSHVGNKSKVDEFANKYLDIVYNNFGVDSIYTSQHFLELYPLLLEDGVSDYVSHLTSLLGEIQIGYFNFFKTNTFEQKDKENFNYKFADLFYYMAVLSFQLNDLELGIVSIDAANTLYKKHLGPNSEQLHKGITLFQNHYKKVKK
jgi:hypothetical protein